jgi:hypothetical protein
MPPMKFVSLLRGNGFRHELTNSMVKEHPYFALSVSLLIYIAPWILILPLFLIQVVFLLVLGILGFGVAGVTGGTH